MASYPWQDEQNDTGTGESTLESPEADSAEQRADVTDDNGDWLRRTDLGTDDEVSEADAVEQLQEVGDDEDDYR